MTFTVREKTSISSSESPAREAHGGKAVVDLHNNKRVRID
jgi:hypothetical protein